MWRASLEGTPGASKLRTVSNTAKTGARLWREQTRNGGERAPLTVGSENARGSGSYKARNKQREKAMIQWLQMPEPNHAIDFATMQATARPPRFVKLWNPLREGRVLSKVQDGQLVDIREDIFSSDTPAWVLAEILYIITTNPGVTFAVATGHPEKMRAILYTLRADYCKRHGAGFNEFVPPANLWLGVRVHNKQSLTHGAALLQDTPAAVRFLLFHKWREMFPGAATYHALWNRLECSPQGMSSARGVRPNSVWADWIAVNVFTCAPGMPEDIIRSAANFDVPVYCPPLRAEFPTCYEPPVNLSGDDGGEDDDGFELL